MKKILLSLSILALLAGCSATALDKVANKVSNAHALTERELARSVVTEAPPVAFLEGSFVPMRKMDRQDYTPEQRSILGLEIETNRNFQNLNEIAGWLSSVTNAPVFLNPELMVVPQTQTQATQAAAVVPSVVAGQNQSQTATAVASKSFSVTYSGKTAGFLDMVAANYGIYWKLEGRNTRFLLTDSRTFRIKALPGDTQLSSIVGGVSNSSGSNSSSSSSTTSSSTGGTTNTTGVTFTGMSVWAGIDAGIKQLLTPNTGKVAVSPSTGTVSVTDTPRVLEQVATFVREQNAALGRQVSVNVRVLSVELNDADDYGINWNAVYNNIASSLHFAVTSALPTASSAAQFVVQTSGTGSWGASSGVIISALSTQGRVSEMTSATLVTLNNQPAPVNVGRQISYLASSSTTQTTSAGTTTSLTPGMVQTGFSMVLIPHILDGKEILVQTSVNLSSLLQMATITSGGSSIQSPDLSTSNFIQRVRMMSGDTLVMAGFDQDQLSAVSNGIGAAKNPVFGSRDSSGKRTMLVILLQPTISI